MKRLVSILGIGLSYIRLLLNIWDDRQFLYILNLHFSEGISISRAL